ncbi:MAG: ankyrin repeat domain-containing protein [Pseudomonadota bacterium]
MRPIELSPERIAELKNQMDAALEEQNLEKIIELIDQGANPDQQRNSDGVFPIFLAAQFKKPDLVKKLIEQGAKVVSPDGIEYSRRDDGLTPLILVAGDGDLDVAQLLVAKGANINLISSRWKQTPLASAVMQGRIDMVAYLLEQNANVEQGSSSETTPLKLTVTPFRNDQPLETRTKIAALLLFYGANDEAVLDHPVILAAKDLLQDAMKSVPIDTNILNALNFGTHPRVGAESPAKILPLDIRQLIGMYVKADLEADKKVPSSGAGKAIIKKLTENHHTQS